jgi:hypothetical protein
MFAIPRMLCMSHSVTFVIEPRSHQRVASMLALLVQLLAMMTRPLHALLLGLPVGTVAP